MRASSNPDTSLNSARSISVIGSSNPGVPLFQFDMTSPQTNKTPATVETIRMRRDPQCCEQSVRTASLRNLFEPRRLVLGSRLGRGFRQLRSKEFAWRSRLRVGKLRGRQRNGCFDRSQNCWVGSSPVVRVFARENRKQHGSRAPFRFDFEFRWRFRHSQLPRDEDVFSRDRPQIWQTLTILRLG